MSAECTELAGMEGPSTGECNHTCLLVVGTSQIAQPAAHAAILPDGTHTS